MKGDIDVDQQIEEVRNIMDAATFTDLHAELPDDVFWALAEEYGLTPEDFTL